MSGRPCEENTVGIAEDLPPYVLHDSVCVDPHYLHTRPSCSDALADRLCVPPREPVPGMNNKSLQSPLRSRTSQQDSRDFPPDA